MAAFSVMKVMLTIFVIAPKIHSEKTDEKTDLESQSSENVSFQLYYITLNIKLI